jgi:hypothetical protein
MSIKIKKPTKPWEPLEFDEHDISSMKALASGTANEGQQKRALGWILEACRLNEQSFVPADLHGRTDAFVEGKRAVGNQIWTLIKVDAETWNKRMAVRRKGDHSE